MVFQNIENSANGSESEDDFKGLFDDIDVNSNKLGATVAKRNDKLVKLLDGIGEMKLGDFQEKSKNGLKNRPTSHEDKNDKWTYCFVLTQFKERTFFNDGTIQYLEDSLNKRITNLGFYENTTKQTTTGTANTSDEEDCNEYLDEAYQMLDALGLDLITFRDDEAVEEEADIDTDEKTDVVPDGTYYLKRKIKRANITIKATMQVTGGKYIVLKGSMVCENEGPGLADNIIEARKAATIVNGKLYNDVTFSSPSAASQFVIGAASNGWTNWKCDDGSAIDKFRN